MAAKAQKKETGKKRVVRSFSELTPEPTDLPQTAVEPSEEESAGGFVVGAVIEETPDIEPLGGNVKRLLAEDRAKAEAEIAEANQQFEDGLISEFEYASKLFHADQTEENYAYYLKMKEQNDAEFEEDRLKYASASDEERLHLENKWGERINFVAGTNEDHSRPKDGDVVYYADNDASHMIEFHSDLEKEPGISYWHDTALDTYLRTDELEWDESNKRWNVVVPSWARSMTGNYRSTLSIPADFSDRMIYEALEEIGPMDESEINEILGHKVAKFFEGLVGSDDEPEPVVATEPVATIEMEVVEEDLDDEVITLDDFEDEEDDAEDTHGMYEIDEVDVADARAGQENGWSVAAQQEAELIGRGAEIVALEAPDVTIVTGDSTTTIDEGAIEIVDGEGEVADIDDGNERKMVMAEIEQFLPPGRLVNKSVFTNMTVDDLKNHLKLLSMNNGGSPAAFKILQEVESEYQTLINSPDTKRRLALLQQRGDDFHKLAQKISKIMGNEVVIKGMRYQEYHQLLEHLTRSTTVVFREIAAAADYMGIKMPIDELVPSMGAVPIMEGMAIDEKTAMYVLRVLLRQVEHWHHACLLLQNNYDTNEKEKATMKERLDFVSERLKEEVANRDSMLTSFKERFIEMPEFYIYVTGGGFLALKDEDERLELRNLTLSNDIRDALFLNSKKAAERIVEVISDTSKFSDYTFKIRRLAAVEA